MKRLIERAVGKIAYELRFALGLENVKDDEVMVNGQNFLDVYLDLYVGEDQARFRKLIRKALISPHCERYFKKWVYPKLLGPGVGFGGDVPRLDASQVEEAARNVGKVFLGPGRYGTVRGWLADGPSQRLFDSEVLQKALVAAGWGLKEASEAIPTGLSEGDFENLVLEAKRRGVMAGFRGRGGLAGLLFDRFGLDWERAATFLLDQYRYGDVCAPRLGETFIDCGACYGDTAVWALDLVGEGGTVVAFEPLPEQAEVARENVQRWLKGHQANVTVENLAVGDSPGTLAFEDVGSGTHQSERGRAVANVVTLDDYCWERGLRPDYVKMDIEGAELSALKGATRIIREMRPRLAICVYHKPAEDLWAIPFFLKELVPSYRFYLKKSHPWVETVLFAV